MRAFFTLLALTSVCVAFPPRPPPDYWLFSWSVRGGVYHFAVVREAERQLFISSFPTVSSIKNVPELEARLNVLPKNVVIGWGDATCVGLTYPPKDIKHRIEKFAAA